MISINRIHSFLGCKHKHMMKCGATPDKHQSPYTVCLPVRFHGFTSIIMSYHSMVPGLISIFLETVRVPLIGTIVLDELFVCRT